MQIESDFREFTPVPVIAVKLELQPPDLTDLRADLTRIVEAPEMQGVFASPKVLRTIPGILRENDWHVSVFLRGNEVIGLAPAGTRPLGFTVDLSTTKNAAYLVD